MGNIPEKYVWSIKNSDVINDYIEGLTEIAEDKLSIGWKAYFITIMFNEISGSSQRKKRIIEEEVVRILRYLTLRTVRYPTSQTGYRNCPFAWAVIDFPKRRASIKKNRAGLRRSDTNNGAHIHINVLVPRITKFNGTLIDEVRNNREKYLGRSGNVQRIEVEATRDLAESFEYAGKSLYSRRVTVEDIIIFPEVASEHSNPRLWVAALRPINRIFQEIY
ncbi:MAG: hypothetical protein KF835_14500 [Xanthobacteraceae bacterium]|nr:hypothetical protein [Xanthobacteraceae bacterium]MCW5675339.1 hypothetical protein [Xanthobacteraceae bacterium]